MKLQARELHILLKIDAKVKARLLAPRSFLERYKMTSGITVDARIKALEDARLMLTNTSALSKIEELKKQINDLKLQAVDEVKQKLFEARKLVTQYEDELAQLTGKSASEEGRALRVRRPSITDEHLRAFVIKAMADGPKTGMNAKQLADAIGQDAMRVRKFIKSNPKVLKRQGSGPGTKFFLP